MYGCMDVVTVAVVYVQRGCVVGVDTKGETKQSDCMWSRQNARGSHASRLGLGLWG